MKVSIEQTFGGLSAEDYAILQAIKHGRARRHHARPTEVLQCTLDALRGPFSQGD
jgi:hypothetical protein